MHCARYTEPTNVQTNRKLWNEYSKNYFKKQDGTPDEWVLKMGKDVGRGASELHHIGDEWSDAKSLEVALSEFLFPFLTSGTAAAEIGVGGGRIASRTCSRVQSLVCFGAQPACRHRPVCIVFRSFAACADISEGMIASAKAKLAEASERPAALFPKAQSLPVCRERFVHAAVGSEVPAQVRGVVRLRLCLRCAAALSTPHSLHCVHAAAADPAPL